MLQKNTIEQSTLELLKELQSHEELKDFHLAGGTSLALQIGHRKSVDIDLFSQLDFDVSLLLEVVEQNFGFKADYTAKNTLKGNIQNIKIDFISHKYQLVRPVVETDKVRLYSTEDIAAMKLNAIAGNGTRSKDFIDVYFILKTKSVEEILEFYKIKYKSRNTLHVLKSLTYFEDINTQDWPEMILECNLKLSEVKKEIEKQIKIFSGKL